MQFTPLAQEQRDAFERDGFLVIPDAIPLELVDQLLAATDRLCQEGLAQEGLNDRHFWQLRNCLIRDEVFLELLDWHRTVPLVVQLLNHNIQLLTSHLIVRPPSPAGTARDYKQAGWHRDGGTAPSHLGRGQPRMFIKVGYWLTDLSEKGRGGIRFVRGSNHWPGRMPPQQDGRDPDDTIEIQAKPGSAVLFENRTLHAVGPNLSSIERKSLFFGYSYRWLRPMDYITMPARLLERCDPIRRQLLGDATSAMGFQLPQEQDVPLRAWLEKHTGQDLDPSKELPGTFAFGSDGRPQR